MTAVLYIYRKAFHASTSASPPRAGVILFAIIFGLTLIQRLRSAGGGRLMALDRRPQLDDRPSRSIPAYARRGGAPQVAVYALLIAIVALLFFVPFLWTISTSFKTLPDSVGFTCSRTRGRPTRGATLWTEFDFPLYIKTASSWRSSSRPPTSSSRARRLRVRAAPVPRPRAPVPARAGDADGARPAAPDPRLRDAHHWHLFGSFPGYILINLVSATNLFFMRQYFLTIPKDFEEAAKLDGAGYFKTFWRVMLPLALPAIAALTILQFQGTWNDFFWPLILFGQGNPTSTRVQLGLAQFGFHYQTLWPQLMAGERDRDPADRS